MKQPSMREQLAFRPSQSIGDEQQAASALTHVDAPAKAEINKLGLRVAYKSGWRDGVLMGLNAGIFLGAATTCAALYFGAGGLIP